MKLNIGSGKSRVDGFTNVDALPWDGNTDIVYDLSKFPYPFKDGEVEEIQMIEFLEHISIRDCSNLLKECLRVLEVGGKINIQVPDCGKAMEYYVNGEVCDCVAHKPTSYEEGRGKKDCENCEGRGKINPNRWLFSFTGAQKHFPHDIHKNIFTEQLLYDTLDTVGFKNINIKSDEFGWKLIAEANK